MDSQYPASGSALRLYRSLITTMEVLRSQKGTLLKAHGLSETQYELLVILKYGPQDGLSCSHIAQHMICHDPDVTRILDRLEKRGMVARRRDPADRRIVVTRVLPTGLALLDIVEATIASLHAQQFAVLLPDELERLQTQITRMRPVPG